MSKESNPGITIRPSKMSQALSLITFMVGELVFTEQTVSPPLPLDEYGSLDKDSFAALKERVFGILNSKEPVFLDLAESINMYILIDMVCKCMVNDSNDVLEELASQNLEIESEEYDKLRKNYLHFGQTFLKELNEKFTDFPEFEKAVQHLR